KREQVVQRKHIGAGGFFVVKKLRKRLAFVNDFSSLSRCFTIPRDFFVFWIAQQFLDRRAPRSFLPGLVFCLPLSDGSILFFHLLSLPFGISGGLLGGRRQRPQNVRIVMRHYRHNMLGHRIDFTAVVLPV